MTYNGVVREAESGLSGTHSRKVQWRWWCDWWCLAVVLRAGIDGVVSLHAAAVVVSRTGGEEGHQRLQAAPYADSRWLERAGWRQRRPRRWAKEGELDDDEKTVVV